MMKINPKYVEVTVASTSDMHDFHITAHRNQELDGKCLWGKVRWSKTEKFPEGYLIFFPKSKAFLIKHNEDYSGGIPYWDRYLVPINTILAIDDDTKLKPGEY